MGPHAKLPQDPRTKIYQEPPQSSSTTLTAFREIPLRLTAVFLISDGVYPRKTEPTTPAAPTFGTFLTSLSSWEKTFTKTNILTNSHAPSRSATIPTPAQTAPEPKPAPIKQRTR